MYLLLSAAQSLLEKRTKNILKNGDVEIAPGMNQSAKLCLKNNIKKQTNI